MKVQINPVTYRAGSMAIINATPHYINIFSTHSVSFDTAQRKYFVSGSEEPTHIIPPSGMLLSAKMQTETVEPLLGIPIQRTAVVSADPIPDGEYYIVSRLYHSAMVTLGEPTDRLLLIGSPVYRVIDGAIAPCGCLALEQG